MALRILLRVVLPAIIGAIAVYFLTGLIPKAYSSYETLYFPLNPAGGIGALGAIAGAPSGGDANAVPGLNGAIMYPTIGSGSQTASGIINSHACLMEVTENLGLASAWHMTPLNASKKLGGQITAEADRTGLLNIRVTSDAPARCVAINREIYRYLERRTRELTSQISRGNGRLVHQRLAEAERELRTAEAKVVSVMQRTPLSSVVDIQKSYIEAQKALSDAKVNRDEERSRLTELESEYHRLAANANVGGTVNALTTLNPAFSELAQELQRRRLQLADAMIAYSSTSPRVYQARKEFENAEAISSQVKRNSTTRSGIVSPEIIRARAEMSALDEAVRSNEAALNATAKSLSSSPKQYAESTIAKSSFEAALTRVDFLKQELEKATILENRDPSRFEVIDQPYEDPTPVAPRKGLFAGVAFAVFAFLFCIPLVVNLVRAAERSAYDQDLHLPSSELHPERTRSAP